ncbi:MAG: DUF5606 domain-containing protein [Tannerellaceae bacterium]|jgi:hypothetical protein|nr:DUF5606 domain-containing protein [Tannerellaceae bacterium]
MFDTIIYVSGQSGLYRLLSRSKNHLILEKLPEGERFPVPTSAHALYVKDITVFTNSEEESLPKIFTSIRDRYNAASLPFDPSSLSKDDLFSLFAEVLPTFDRTRVYPTDICKIFKWYNILIAAGITSYEATPSETETETITT